MVIYTLNLWNKRTESFNSGKKVGSGWNSFSNVFVADMFYRFKKRRNYQSLRNSVGIRVSTDKKTVNSFFDV